MKVSAIFRNLNWDEAMELPAKLNAEKHLGFDDWYLPDINELFLMFDKKTGKPKPELKDMKGLWFWSSSSYATHASFAWYVYFGDGYVNYGDKNDDYAARCVRRTCKLEAKIK